MLATEKEIMIEQTMEVFMYKGAYHTSYNGTSAEEVLSTLNEENTNLYLDQEEGISMVLQVPAWRYADGVLTLPGKFGYTYVELKLADCVYIVVDREGKIFGVLLMVSTACHTRYYMFHIKEQVKTLKEIVDSFSIYNTSKCTSIKADRYLSDNDFRTYEKTVHNQESTYRKLVGCYLLEESDSVKYFYLSDNNYNVVGVMLHSIDHVGKSTIVYMMNTKYL